MSEVASLADQPAASAAAQPAAAASTPAGELVRIEPPAPAHKPFGSKKWWWGRLILLFNDHQARRNRKEPDAWCLCCGKGLKYYNSTGNLDKHAEQHTEWQQEGSIRSHMVASSALQDAVVRWMVTTFKPISEVEHESFKTMMLTANAHAKVPTREKVCKLLDSYEDTARDGIRQLLREQYVSLTSDIWTSPSQEPYISLTTTHLDVDFDLILLPLECALFTGSHTGLRILHKTEQMLERSSITPEQVSAMVIDNAANAKLAGNLASFDSMPCAAHTLQLTVKQVLEQPEIAALLKKVRKIVGAFKHSALKVHELKDEQKRLNMKLRKLLQDVVTRWNSVYLMIDVFLDNRKPVEVVCLRHKDPGASSVKRARTSAGAAAGAAAPTAGTTTGM